MSKTFLKIVVGASLLIGFTRCAKDVTIERIEVQKQVQGAVIHSGSGSPSLQIGKIGDFYIDIDQARLYGAKTDKGWGAYVSLKGEGAQNGSEQYGIDGRDGAAIHKGTTPPNDELGKIGDLYFDTANTKLYGPKTNNGWGESVELGDIYTLKVNTNTLLVPLNERKTITIILGSGQYRLEEPTTPDLMQVSLKKESSRDVIEIEGLKYGTTNLILHDTKTQQQLSIEVSVIIPPSSYELNHDEDELVKWEGSETEIDLNADPILKKIKRIGHIVFRNKKMSYIKLNEGLEEIGDEAFEWMPNLTSIQFPSTLKVIGNRAFYESKLTEVTIPGNVKNVVHYAFYQCSNLESVSIEAGVETIGEATFWGCPELKNVTIGNGVKTIGKEAFTYLPKLETITIPGSVTEIGEDAFYYCVELKNVVLEDGVRSIGERTFAYLPKLQSLTIPNSVTEIGPKSFAWNAGLTEVKLSENLTVLEKYAFYKCANLTQITIPNSVTHMREGVFDGASIAEIVIPENVREIDLADCFQVITLKGETPPKLPKYLFKYATSLQRIYVPAQSVDTYKNDEQWKLKADIIFPIP